MFTPFSSVSTVDFEQVNVGLVDAGTKRESSVKLHKTI